MTVLVETAACLARQPIFDGELAVYGYELLYRSCASDCPRPFGESEETMLTASTLTTALTDIGLNGIVGDHPAWVNVGAEFLAGDLRAVLPPERTVIEVLETASGDAVVGAVKALRAEGYCVALDDFVFRPGSEALVELADVVKIDVLARAWDLEEQVEALAPFGVTLLAEKVETYEMLERCRALGFTLFQGHFLSRPRTMTTSRVSGEAAVRLRLVSRLNDPELSLNELTELIAADVTLSYRLLRYINSSFVGLRHHVETLREAVIALGSRRVRSWATLLFLAEAGAGRQELVVTALVRARMCQSLATSVGEDLDRAFMVGLLSVVDALTDRPLVEALEELPVGEQIEDALLHHDGPLGDLLERVKAFEDGAFDRATDGLLEPAAATRAYLDALDWSNRLIAGVDA